MRIFDLPITPAMSVRISKNATIVDRILVSTSIVYFLLYSILPPYYAVICAISFLIITELLGSISQSLLSMSEQIRLSAILSAALQPKMSENLTESSKIFENLDAQVDLNHLDETSYIGIQLSQFNKVQSERDFDLLGFSVVFVAPSLLGFVCNIYLW
jgi:hypothetical protein